MNFGRKAFSIPAALKFLPRTEKCVVSKQKAVGSLIQIQNSGCQPYPEPSRQFLIGCANTRIRPGIEQFSELIKQKSLKHETKVWNWKLLMKGWLFGLRFAFRNSFSTPLSGYSDRIGT